MRKLLPFIASGLCLLTGCQTPLFSGGLFGSLSSNKTLTAQKPSTGTSQTASTSTAHMGGRGWRNAASRAAENEAQAPATSINNVNRLREFLAKGNDAMQKGLHDDARIQYETVLSIEPQHATAHHMLGRISDMSRKFDEAERHYLAALSANREDGYLLSDLGYSYLQQGRLDEARQYLTQAITLEPDLAIAKVNLAAVYAYGGDQRGALAWLRQVGSEQQAQETLASLNSRPAPWVVNGAAGALASAPDKYSVNQDGQVLDANGQPLQTWEEVQAAMKELRTQGNSKWKYEQELREFQERERINRAMAQQAGYDVRAGGQTGDADLNRQIQAIQREPNGNRQNRGNSQPMYVGPPDNTPARLPSNDTATLRTDWNSQDQIQQYQSAGRQGQYAEPQDPYTGLLNPAGPTGFQQPGYPNQQFPPGQAGGQGLETSPQFPTQPSGYQGSPSQQQYRDPNYGSGQNQTLGQGQYQGQPMPTQPPSVYDQSAGTNPAYLQYPDQNSGRTPRPGQQLPVDAAPVDQYGNPILRQQPSNPAWNGQSPSRLPNQGSSAPNPNYFGQGQLQGSVNPQTGMYVGDQSPASAQFPSQYRTGQNEQASQYPVENSHYQQSQPTPLHRQQLESGASNPQQIQQLGFNGQPAMARIDRGQRIVQYSEADRQAMQLGMAAGFGAFSPVSTGQNRNPQPMPNNAPSGNGPQNYGPQGNWPPQDAQGTAGNPSFSYDQQPVQRNLPGQFPPQTQQLPDRGYPGAVPATSRQLPGQANFQTQNQHIHGQSIADQSDQDPQTAQPWLRMPTSQADVTMPAAFSSSTQPTQQQSQNYQRPDVANQAWQNGVLTSPTTRPGFGQPHMTDPYLRPANSQTGQPADGQTNQSASWPTRQ